MYYGFKQEDPFTENLILAVDCMGGDNAPACVIEGCRQYLDTYPADTLRLFGHASELTALTEKYGGRVTVIEAGEPITMHDEPMMAVRRKQDSSLVLAMKDVKAGSSHAVVSAGSTGAILMGGMVFLRMLKGIARPALGPVIPGLHGPFLLIDSGANADCQPEYLKMFGMMGSAYMHKVMGVGDPSVGLVNIGAEEEKGNKLYKEAHALMKEQKVYRFTGNVEAREIQMGDTDVIVCDGFTGNVILKYAEGFVKAMIPMLKQSMLSSLRGKIGALLLKKNLKGIKKRMNMDEYGGAPLLGVDGVAVKAHGSSNGYAFFKAMEQARQMVLGGVVNALKQGLEEITKTEE